MACPGGLDTGVSCMVLITDYRFHLAVLCDSLRCGAYGTYCYGIS